MNMLVDSNIRKVRTFFERSASGLGLILIQGRCKKENMRTLRGAARLKKCESWVVTPTWLPSSRFLVHYGGGKKFIVGEGNAFEEV